MDDAQRRGMRTDRIERCLDSGMTIGEWCELNKVGEFNLCKWMARLREEELALIHFHGHADERLLPMLGDHDRLVVRLHRASKCGSIFMILNWNTNAHLRRFPFALVLFLELRNLVCPKPARGAAHLGIMAEGAKAKAGMARHRSSTLPSLCGLLRLERIAARKGYNPKFCASCIFYL